MDGNDVLVVPENTNGGFVNCHGIRRVAAILDVRQGTDYIVLFSFLPFHNGLFFDMRVRIDFYSIEREPLVIVSPSTPEPEPLRAEAVAAAASSTH